MVNQYDIYRRLEPAPPSSNLDRGFLAEVADPAWFLARQWKLGELQGEDASSPVSVVCRVSHQKVELHAGDPLSDPAIVPPEAIVESEPDDWWTPGRRIRIGRLAAATLPPLASADPTLILRNLPVPYEAFDATGYDGYRVWLQRASLGLPAAAFADVPSTAPQDLWNPAELCYETSFKCASSDLRLTRHTGGQIDWHSVDANQPLTQPATMQATNRILVNRMSYPGAPHPRWWQIEDHEVDIGGFPPDRSHFATMLLIDLIAAHSNDWFLFPIAASTGTAVTFHDAQVIDSFGDTWSLQVPTNWSLFAVEGLKPSSLLVWPTVATPIHGPVLEDVVLGQDEDANVLWAVEQRVNGRDLPTAPRPSKELAATAAVSTDRKSYSYQPTSPMFPYWHPYTVQEVAGRRRYVQGRLADLSQPSPVLMPEPRASVLYDRHAKPAEPAHQVEPATVPVNGLRLERRMMLARGADARPILWAQRRRLPLLAPPAMRLEFDRLITDPM
ncbi:MAG TPA: hypothetical protein VER03_26010 [Bryobacteraceae bacterium]|nr:hypothetical protein [Bryobacteraceae bacterium]